MTEYLTAIGLLIILVCNIYISYNQNQRIKLLEEYLFGPDTDDTGNIGGTD
jgi:hypothetical protein